MCLGLIFAFDALSSRVFFIYSKQTRVAAVGDLKIICRADDLLFFLGRETGCLENK